MIIDGKLSQARLAVNREPDHNQLSIELILLASADDRLDAPMLLQGNLRQDEFPTLSGGPQGPAAPPDGAAFGRHPAYEEDERQFVGPPGQCSIAFCVEPCDIGFPALCNRQSSIGMCIYIMSATLSLQHLSDL